MILARALSPMQNALQDGRPVSFNPAVLYRGLLANAGSIAPITAVQFGANKLYATTLANSGVDTEAGLAKIATAAMAGATSGVVACPPELLVIQQQKHGKDLGTVYKEIVQKNGPLALVSPTPSFPSLLPRPQGQSPPPFFRGYILARESAASPRPACAAPTPRQCHSYPTPCATYPWEVPAPFRGTGRLVTSPPPCASRPPQMRGITPTMMREGIYTACYLGLAPIVKAKLQDQGMSDGTAFLGSAIGSGVTAGTLTHPFDTAKTRMQSNIAGGDPAYRTTASTLSSLLKEVRMGKQMRQPGRRTCACVRAACRGRQAMERRSGEIPP